MTKRWYAILILLLTACAGATPTLVPTSEFTSQIVSVVYSDPEAWQNHIRSDWVFEVKVVFILDTDGKKDIGIELTDEGRATAEAMSGLELGSVATDLYDAIKLLYPNSEFSLLVFAQYYDIELKDEYGLADYEFEYTSSGWLVSQMFIGAHFLLGEEMVRIW